MNRREAFPSNFLKAEDLPPDGINVRLIDIKQEPFREQIKNIGTFQTPMGQKKFIINVTNWDLITALLGTDESNDWLGREIPIWPTTCQDENRKWVPCIRVRERAPIEQPSGSIAAMLHSFADLNVTRLMIEQRLGHSVVELTPQERVQLGDIHSKMMAGGGWPLARPDLTGYLERQNGGELVVQRGW